MPRQRLLPLAVPRVPEDISLLQLKIQEFRLINQSRSEAGKSLYRAGSESGAGSRTCPTPVANFQFQFVSDSGSTC
jgi:hypothetical protein